MKNYGILYEDGDNDGNEDGTNNDNAASGSGSDGLIFDPITTPWSCGGGLGDDGDGAAAVVYYVFISQTIYLTYKYHIKDVL